MLYDDEGAEHVGDEVMGKMAVAYFKHIFASSHPTLISKTLENFEARLSDDINDVLRADYTEEEVRVAWSQMHPIKALDPNGMCPMFFQTY